MDRVFQGLIRRRGDIPRSIQRAVSTVIYRGASWPASGHPYIQTLFLRVKFYFSPISKIADFFYYYVSICLQHRSNNWLVVIMCFQGRLIFTATATDRIPSASLDLITVKTLPSITVFSEIVFYFDYCYCFFLQFYYFDFDYCFHFFLVKSFSKLQFQKKIKWKNTF